MEYQFDAKKITEILNSFGCNISPKEIKQPTIECITQIYKKFIETCLAVKPVSYEMDPPNTLFRFNEDVIKAQAPAFRFLQFYKLLLYFFDMCGINASFYDIFNPSKKTFQKQISLIINFAKFEFSELKAFHKIQDENKKFEEQCEAIKADYDELISKNYKLKSERAKKEPMIQAKKANIAALKEHITKLKADLKQLELDKQSAIKEENSLQSQINELKSRQTQYDKKLKLYEKLIVKSPTRLNKECEKTEYEIIDIGNLIKSKTEETEKFKKLLHEKEKFIDSYSSITEVLNDFYNGQVLKANEKIKEIENLKKDITNYNFTLNEIESNKNMLINQLDKLKIINKDINDKFNIEMKSLKDKENSINLTIKNSILERSVLENNKSQIIQKIETIKMKLDKEIVEKGLIEIVKYEELTKSLLRKRDNLIKYYEARKLANEKMSERIEKELTKFYENITF